MYLNCHSYYSLRYGTLSVERLLELAQNHGVKALALTDINSSQGIMDFAKQAPTVGIKPLVGIEFRNQNEYCYTGIARNREGFRELNEFLSYHKEQKLDFPQRAPVFDHAFVIYSLQQTTYFPLREHEFWGIKPRELRKLLSLKIPDKGSKLLVFSPVSFESPADFPLHQHLRAIDNNILLSKLEEKHLANPSDRMLALSELKEIYADFPKIWKNTEAFIDQCSFEMDFKSVKNKQVFTTSRYDDKILLEKLSMDGLSYRYGKNPEAEKRIKHELEIIHKLGFSAYFLITWDVVRYSMSRGFYHVGRGSGANSIVAYCLRITDVDPIELDLYFERFLNPKRTSPPDFDIDYSWKERDEVIDYIFKRYGRKHTALLGMTATFKDRSIIRELGKVQGLPKSEIDALIDYPNDPMHQSSISRYLNELGKKMEDFPNLRSIHAGGILISEEPVSYYTALDMPPKGFPTTQWDMYVAEEIGFEKLDILSQRGIGHIRDAVSIVGENTGKKIDVHAVQDFKKDPKIQGMLAQAQTIGAFYIESPAMRGLLTKLRCSDYTTLVAASSIIRPGVARSGMMKEYIKRFHHPNGFRYLHPIMEQTLSETFGIMVYQEDVLKICHHFAGLDLADADVLRRAMSGKYRSRKEFERIKERFFSNCRQAGHDPQTSLEVWRQIESFAGYSFSKAHSASYAVESFQSLFLKTYFPREFMVAVINNFGGFYHTWVYFNEAKRWGASIQLPCVNRSRYLTRIIGEEIYIGFIHLQHLEEKSGKRIEQARNHGGPFSSLADFISRTALGLESILLLIKIGAFRFTGKKKADLLWEAHFLVSPKKETEKPAMLFPIVERNFQLPSLESSLLEDAYDEIELLQFPVSLSYFDLLQTSFRGNALARDLHQSVGKVLRMMGQLVTSKYVRTVRGQIMQFGTFIDVEGEFFDTVHFPDSLQQYPFKGYGVYLILGKVVSEFGFPSIEVQKMAKMPIHPDPRYAD